MRRASKKQVCIWGRSCTCTSGLLINVLFGPFLAGGISEFQSERSVHRHRRKLSTWNPKWIVAFWFLFTPTANTDTKPQRPCKTGSRHINSFLLFTVFFYRVFHPDFGGNPLRFWKAVCGQRTAACCGCLAPVGCPRCTVRVWLKKRESEFHKVGCSRRLKRCDRCGFMAPNN